MHNISPRRPGVALEVEAELLPAASALDGFRQSPAGERLLLGGGEDYELLLAVPPRAMRETKQAFADAFDLPLTPRRERARGEGADRARTGGPGAPGGDSDHFEVGR